MKNTILTTSTLALLAVTAQAASVAINFQRGSNGGTLMDSTDTAGVVAQANWNNVTQAAANGGSIADMTDDSGAPSGISVTWAGDTSWSSANGTTNGDNKMMDGYLDDTTATPGGSTVDFTNITFPLYDVFVYFGSDGNGRTGTVTDGTTTFSYTTNSALGGGFPDGYVQTTDTAGGNPLANYAVFTGLSGSALQITNNRGSNNTGIHGIQVVQVPEPGSFVLLLSGLGLVALRRRR